LEFTGKDLLFSKNCLARSQNQKKYEERGEDSESGKKNFCSTEKKFAGFKLRCNIAEHYFLIGSVLKQKQILTAAFYLLRSTNYH
jgi:hypothetical protein